MGSISSGNCGTLCGVGLAELRCHRGEEAHQRHGASQTYPPAPNPMCLVAGCNGLQAKVNEFTGLSVVPKLHRGLGSRMKTLVRVVDIRMG